MLGRRLFELWPDWDHMIQRPMVHCASIGSVGALTMIEKEKVILEKVLAEPAPSTPTGGQFARFVILGLVGLRYRGKVLLWTAGSTVPESRLTHKLHRTGMRALDSLDIK